MYPIYMTKDIRSLYCSDRFNVVVGSELLELVAAVFDGPTSFKLDVEA